MRIFYLIIFLLFSSMSFGQIVSADAESSDSKSKESDSLKNKNGMEIYVGFSPAYTYRTLESNTDIFGEELGYRENEEGAWISSFSAGVRNELNKNLLMEIGVGFYRNRETFSFSNTDTLFSYENTYRHITFPIRLAYTFGEEISFYGGIGVMPKAFLSQKRVITTLNESGKEVEETLIEKDGYNFFVLDAIATIGTRIELNPNYGIFAMAEGRRQLVDGYSPQSPYIRKPYALGFHFGVQVYL